MRRDGACAVEFELSGFFFANRKRCAKRKKYPLEEMKLFTFHPGEICMTVQGVERISQRKTVPQVLTALGGVGSLSPNFG